MSHPTTTAPSSPTLVQPEGTPAHVATLSTAELDTLCVEMDRYLAAFSHRARAAPGPLRPIAEQAWFSMDAMFSMYRCELEGRGSGAVAAEGGLAVRPAERSVEDAEFPRPSEVRPKTCPHEKDGPQFPPSKSTDWTNMRSFGSQISQWYSPPCCLATAQQ